MSNESPHNGKMLNFPQIYNNSKLVRHSIYDIYEIPFILAIKYIIYI